MLRHRYTAWDGSRRVRLDPDEVFSRLAEYLSSTDDLEEALDAFLRDGFDGDAFEVLGIDDLIEQVREELAGLYDRFSLEHALDRHAERLEDLVSDERAAWDDADPNGFDKAAREKARRILDRLPREVDRAIARLRGQRLRSPRASSELERFVDELDDIERVAAFVRTHGKLFRGREQLDFDDALELIDRIDALRRLEQQLLARDFDAIDLDAAGELLGARMAEAIANLGELLAMLVEAGYLRPKGGRLVLSPKGARKLGRMALREIHANLRFDSGGRHDTTQRGPMAVRGEGSRRYRFGDPLHLDVTTTVANALRRGGGRRASPLPVRLEPDDLAVYETTYSTRAATVLLLDMSWSMSWEGRFAAAKKVALAMDVLMRSSYPRDYFGMVGFYTRAVELRFEDLPEATWNMGDPFTNLQGGLRMATDLLDRQPGTNKSMIVITDGQPTAYHAGGRLFCEWPMSVGGLSTRATVETLKEVERVTRKGIVINTFMLDDSPPLRAFVERMTAINKGRAFYTTPDQLGRFVLVDYVARRRRVI